LPKPSAGRWPDTPSSTSFHWTSDDGENTTAYFDVGLAEMSTVSAVVRARVAYPGTSEGTSLVEMSANTPGMGAIGVPAASALYSPTYMETAVEPEVENSARESDTRRYVPGPHIGSPSTKSKEIA
jgi:hypothetical protein